MSIRERFGRWWYGEDEWNLILEIQADTTELQVALIEMQAELERVQKVIERLGG